MIRMRLAGGLLRAILGAALLTASWFLAPGDNERWTLVSLVLACVRILAFMACLRIGMGFFNEVARQLWRAFSLTWPVAVIIAVALLAVSFFLAPDGQHWPSGAFVLWTGKLVACLACIGLAVGLLGEVLRPVERAAKARQTARKAPAES